MKKPLLLSAILFSTIFSAFAQYYNNAPVPKLGIGISSGIAVGPVSSAYPGAGEILLNFEFPISKSPVSLLLSTGYTFYVSQGGYSVGFYSSDYGSSTYSYGSVVSFIPIEAGVKIYAIHKFFIEGNVGASFNINSNSTDYTGEKTALIYAPGAGYSFPLGNSNRSVMDVSLIYENRVEPGGGYSQVALRALWNFNL
jgi:hypothetical protein